MERSDNDKLAELSDKEKQNQEKALTKESKLLNEIEMELRRRDGEHFDFHLFLVLFNIFKESQSDIRLRQYAAQMPTKDIQRFKDTVRFFNEFLHGFVIRNVDGTYDNAGLVKLIDQVHNYNKARGEIIYRLPELEEGNFKIIWNMITNKLRRGQERLLKK